MGFTGAQLATRFARLEGEAKGLAHAYNDLAQRCQVDLDAFEKELATRAWELAAAYLPSLSEDDLSRAERLTGFRGFTRRDPHKAMAHELAVLEHTVQRIQADPRFVRRELLIGPRGEHILEHEEARSHFDEFDKQCRVFEDHDGFQELIETRYDTPDFTVRFYEPRYWKLWAAGDRITAALGMDDFGDDVLPAYIEVAQHRRRWRGFVEEAQLKINEVAELVRQRDQAIARMPQLPEIYLDGCRRMLGEFLVAADLPLLEQWLLADGDQGDRAVVMAMRVVAGIRAKIEFVRELIHGLRALVTQLGVRAQKYLRKRAKFSRSKHYYRQFTDRDADLKFDAKSQKLRERGTQIARALDRLRAYDDYAEFRLDNDSDLWWREMTGSRPPRIMASTRSYYDRHPQARPARDRAREERQRQEQDRQRNAAAAAAAASEELTDVGYFS